MTANDYPVVVKGGPVDPDSWYNPVAEDLTAVKPQRGKGLVASQRDAATNVSTTTTEIVVTSVQFVAESGAVYEVTARGPSESSVAGDSIKCRIRWKHTAVADITGVEVDSTGAYAEPNANRTVGNIVLLGWFTATESSTVTVVVTIVRNGGSGNVKMNGTGVPVVIHVNRV